MKRNTLILSAFSIATLAFYSFTTQSAKMENLEKSNLFSSTPPAGKTGAPNENNCTQCHMGTPNPGTGVLSLTFSGANDEYVPGSTYTMDVSLTGAGAKNGFEIVALRNSDDAQVGSWSLTNSTNTQIQNASGRSYVSHTTAGNSSTSWNFDWEAPASNEGDVTFYLASLISNNDGSTNGDNVYLTELVVSGTSGVGINEAVVDMDNSLNLIQSGENLNLSMQLAEAGELEVVLTDLSGKQVYNKSYGSQIQGEMVFNPINTNGLSNGLYVLSIRLNENLVTRKIKL